MGAERDLEGSGGRLTRDSGEPPGGSRRAHPGQPRDPGVDAAILTAAVDLLAEIGYARLTMEQVAARAGVGKASLYLRWPNKVALVAEAIQYRSGRHTGPSGHREFARADSKLFLRALLHVAGRRGNGRWPP